MANMIDKWGQRLADGGFVQIPNHLLLLNRFIQKEQRLTPVELLVVFQLVGLWRQREAMPFPSMKTLGDQLGVSERQVQRAMARLVKDGFIKKRNRRSRGVITSNSYDLAPLVDELDTIAKRYPDAYAKDIEPGTIERSLTSKDLPKRDAGDQPIKMTGLAESTAKAPGDGNETKVARGVDMSWFKPFEF